MILPKGKYYIGDPCYIFDESWSSILEQTDFFRNDNPIFGISNFFVHSTYWGDGTFNDTKGNNFAVDSGLIGILPYELLSIDKVLDEKDTYFLIKEFDSSFAVSYDEGVFIFGDIYIDTYLDEKYEDFK